MPDNRDPSNKPQASLMPIRDLSTASLYQGARFMRHGEQSKLDPAYVGHQFIFATHGIKFMEMAGGNYKVHSDNLKNLLERASTSFSGQNSRVVTFTDTTDGFSNRKMQHPTMATKDCDQITITLHEFKGLVLKEALDSWVQNTLDEGTQRAHYAGLAGLTRGGLEFSIENHTMGILVVQVDPTWTVIQDAAFYLNLFPTEVNFDYFSWTKGTIDVVKDYQLTLAANEVRGPHVMEAAKLYMNAHILSRIDSTFTYIGRNSVQDPNVPVPNTVE